MANPFHELLLQKPLFHPGESGIIVLYGHNHGGLVDNPVPQPLRDGLQPDGDSPNHHEQEPAGGELVPAAQDIFKKFEHVSSFSNRHKLPEIAANYWFVAFGSAPWHLALAIGRRHTSPIAGH